MLIVVLGMLAVGLLLSAVDGIEDFADFPDDGPDKLEGDDGNDRFVGLGGDDELLVRVQLVVQRDGSRPRTGPVSLRHRGSAN